MAGTLLPQPLSSFGVLLPGCVQLRLAGGRAPGEPPQHVRPLLRRSLWQQGVAVSRPERVERLAGPVAAKTAAAANPLALEATAKAEGTFFLQNVYESWVPLPKEKISGLRIIQVLPKTTPHASNPAPGLAGTSPGKQVLGTVPVESDGSAYFRARPVSRLQFQALDSQGQAVQMMYSLVYLQPGEKAACAGCHERNAAAVPVDSRATAEALRRPPSDITPGPDGSKPLSYPLLVQPVLDRQCVSCHNPSAPKEKSGRIFLAGRKAMVPSRSPTTSWLPYVPYSAWGHRPTPRTYPDQFGARASKLMKLLLAGHHDVRLVEGRPRPLDYLDGCQCPLLRHFQPQGPAAAVQRRADRRPGFGVAVGQADHGYMVPEPDVRVGA